MQYRYFQSVYILWAVIDFAGTAEFWPVLFICFSAVGLPDPFAKVVVDGSGQCHSTDTVKSTLDPKWNQHYDLWANLRFFLFKDATFCLLKSEQKIMIEQIHKRLVFKMVSLSWFKYSNDNLTLKHVSTYIYLQILKYCIAALKLLTTYFIYIVNMFNVLFLTMSLNIHIKCMYTLMCPVLKVFTYIFCIFKSLLRDVNCEYTQQWLEWNENTNEWMKWEYKSHWNWAQGSIRVHVKGDFVHCQYRSDSRVTEQVCGNPV